MAKIGTKEAQLRSLREDNFDFPTFLKRGHPDCPVKEPKQPERPASSAVPVVGPGQSAQAQTEEKESVMRTKTDQRGSRQKARGKVAGHSPAKGSKMETVRKLLTRQGGCTRAQVLKATGWPAVSMQAMAKALGLTLVVSKVQGKPTNYSIKDAA